MIDSKSNKDNSEDKRPLKGYKYTEHINGGNKNMIESAKELANKVGQSSVAVLALLTLDGGEELKMNKTIEFEFFEKLAAVCNEYIGVADIKLKEIELKENKDGKSSDTDKGSDMENSFSRDLINKLIARR